MKVETFKKLKEIEEEKEMNDLKVGDYFLYGRAMIDQKTNKETGQPISYYKVLNKEGVTIEFGIGFDTLE
jgi:hypothetical protein